jgi:hypothetical protein
MNPMTYELAAAHIADLRRHACKNRLLFLARKNRHR